MKKAFPRWLYFLTVILALLSLPGNTSSAVAQPEAFEIYLPSVTRPAFNWQKVTSGLPDDWVRDILVHPEGQHEIFVAYRDSGIYKSSDHGQTWKVVWGFAQAPDPSVRQLAAAPSDPSILYATAINRVLRSTNRGESWSNVWPPAYSGGGWALAVDPEDADHVFIGINADVQFNIYETENGGQTWEAKNLSVGSTEGIISLAFDPLTPGKLYAGGNTDLSQNPRITRLFISLDEGETWTLYEENFPATKRLTTINFNPCLQQQIFVTRQGYGNDQYLHRSDDNGTTWVSLPLVDDDLVVSPVPPCPIYSDMRRSLDNGLTWKSLIADFYSFIPDPENLRFSAWAADPWSDVLWLGTRYHGVFYLRDAVPHSPGG